MTVSGKALAAAWRAIIAQRHSPKAAARVAREAGLTVSKAQVKAWNDLQSQRLQAQTQDPLIVARNTRALRAPSYRAPWRDDSDRRREADEREAAERETLRRAARIARSLGWQVRSSTSRSGHISSYYLTPPCSDPRSPIRVSDHELPATPKRDYYAALHGRGGHDGYHGAEIIIDAPRSATWLRRALTLAAAGRSVG